MQYTLAKLKISKNNCMPTKIVTGRSNPQDGEINQFDLKRITQDFENFVEIKSTSARSFVKIDTITIPVPILDHLLDMISPTQRETSRIDIKFGITLPDQKQCTDGVTDASDHLTAVLFINRNGIELQDQPGNFIITPGFRESSNNGGAEGACCPVITPKKP